jgi:hypothetical protein
VRRAPGRAADSQEQVIQLDRETEAMSLITPESVWNLQKTLAAKAKGNPTYRFYSLYDKICRRDVLALAYACCKENGGSPEADGQTFEQIEAQGRAEWLDGLAEELKQKRYKTEEVKAWGAQTGVDTQTRRKTAASGNSSHPRSSGGDGNGSDPGTDFRTGLSRRAIWLPSGAECPRCRAHHSPLAQSGT